ncbi:unnamed protein product, partial [Porites evermanni]
HFDYHCLCQHFLGYCDEHHKLLAGDHFRGVLWHDNFLHHFLHVHYFGLYCTTWPYFDALKALDAKFK